MFFRNSILFFFALFLVSCTQEFSLNPNSNQLVVVEGFLYSGEPVDDIRLISTLSLSGADSAGKVITTARVTLYRNDTPYELSLRDKKEGRYAYDGDDLEVNPGDHFLLEINIADLKVTAETTVPKPPRLHSIDNNRLVIPEIDPAEVTDSLKQQLDLVAVPVFWDRVLDSKEFYYARINNTDEHAKPLLIKAHSAPTAPVTVETALFADNRLDVGYRDITHTGEHRITIFHAERIYADLYFAGINHQDRQREINESITNVNNGLGIFTSFASSSTIIQVIEK